MLYVAPENAPRFETDPVFWQNLLFVSGVYCRIPAGQHSDGENRKRAGKNDSKEIPRSRRCGQQDFRPAGTTDRKKRDFVSCTGATVPMHRR